MTKKEFLEDLETYKKALQDIWTACTPQPPKGNPKRDAGKKALQIAVKALDTVELRRTYIQLSSEGSAGLKILRLLGRNH